jgi:hypothetical protein
LACLPDRVPSTSQSRVAPSYTTVQASERVTPPHSEATT